MHAKCDQDKEENQASHDNNDSDKGAECTFWTAPARRIKVKSLHGTPPSSPDTKTVHEGKGEVHKYFWQSRNDGKYDQNKQGNRTLLDSSHSDNEAENVVWNTCPKNMKVKSLHGTPPTSRGKKNAPEEKEEVCENFRPSRNHGKIDLGKQEHRELLDSNHTKSEREHEVSTSHLIHTTKKGLRDANPSSPDPKNAPEEKEEVCENFRPSRNHGKIDLGKQEHRELLDSNHTKSEREHEVSTSHLIHTTKKGLRDANPSSPDPKNAPEEKEEVCENFRPSRNHGKIDLGKQEHRELLDSNHTKSEREHEVSTSHLIHTTKKGLRDANPSSPDPKNAPEEKEEVCENFRPSRNHGKIDLGKQEHRELLDSNHTKSEREHEVSTSHLIHTTKKGLRDANPSSPDPKNAPEEKEEVCENFRPSRNHGKIDLGKQEHRELLDSNHTKSEREHEVSTSHLIHTTKKGLRDANPSSPDPKNAPEEKEEVCENFRPSRNHGKIDLGKQEHRELLDSNHTKSEREHEVSTSHLIHTTKKGLRDANPSSPDPKNAPEEKEEVCENFRPSRNHGKIDLGKQEHRELLDSNHTKSEREHEVSTSHLIHTTKKGLRDANPSSPDPKNAPEEKEEVCENFRPSRNHGKIDLGKQEHRELLDSNHTKSEREHEVSTSHLIHTTKKGLRDANPSSPDPKSVSEPLPLSYVGKFTAAEDQRAEQKINKHKEDDLGTSSHRNRLRTANIAQLDDARILGTLVSNA
ncbi:involucrin-like, partial [Marmota monax]|uniref:involucrin-like n=1 Tax=Marmota monax TaxID=9995 RepID=UPI0026F2B0A8